MKYLVVGLGNLGRAIAINLSHIGHEVIGVDNDTHKVDNLKEILSGTVCLDSTDKTALKTLPLNEMDAIFITFGKDFGTSVQTTATLKNLNVNKLIVRSISSIHETVIRAIGVSEIMTPEKDYAAIYASQSQLGDLFKDWYKITETHHIYIMNAPKAIVGQTLDNIGFETNFYIRLAGIERAEQGKSLIGLKQTYYEVLNDLSPTTQVLEGDKLILFGRLENLQKLADL